MAINGNFAVNLFGDELINSLNIRERKMRGGLAMMLEVKNLAVAFGAIEPLILGQFFP